MVQTTSHVLCEHYDLDIYFEKVLNNDDMLQYDDCRFRLRRVLLGATGPMLEAVR